MDYLQTRITIDFFHFGKFFRFFHIFIFLRGTCVNQITFEILYVHREWSESGASARAVRKSVDHLPMGNRHIPLIDHHYRLDPAGLPASLVLC